MARFWFLALALALMAITFAAPIPLWADAKCKSLEDGRICAKPAPESPSPAPSPSPLLPSGCHRIGGHVVCERPVSAAPESPSPSPTPSLSAERLLPIINAMPGPVTLDTLAQPAKPQAAADPEHINDLNKSYWEYKEKAWREYGIIVDFLPAESEEKADGEGREFGGGGEDDEDEDDDENDEDEDEDEDEDDEEDEEDDDDEVREVQKRELGDCKAWSWGC